MQMPLFSLLSFFFFFNDTATTEIYTLSLHDALPIYFAARGDSMQLDQAAGFGVLVGKPRVEGKGTRSYKLTDRKSTRLNSSHSQISYAVFCLKKKKKQHTRDADTVRHKPHMLAVYHQ